MATYRSHCPPHKILIGVNHFPCLKVTSRLGEEAHAVNPSTPEGRPVDFYESEVSLIYITSFRPVRTAL